MKAEEKNLSLILVTCLASAQVLLEGMDELQETKYYKQSLKRTLKTLDQELIKVFDKDITKLYGISEETMRQIQSGIETISKELATLDPARIVMLGEMLKDGTISFEDGR